MAKKILCTGTLVIDIFAGPITRPIVPNDGFRVEIEHHAGGNAYNVAVGLARLGVPGRSVFCAGACGDDYLTGLLESRLRKHRINPLITVYKGSRTPKSIILGFNDLSRSFLGDNGPNSLYTAEAVIRDLKRIKPAVFYIGEIGAMKQLDKGIKKILLAAKELGCVTVVDYIIIGDWFSKNIFDCGSLIDVFHINDYEAEILTATKDAKKSLKEIMKTGIGLSIISRGHNTLLFGHNNKEYEMPVFPVKCVDSTGGGDAFTAGVIKGIMRLPGMKIRTEKQLLEVIISGQAAGACAVTAVGCTDGVSVKKSEGLKKRFGRRLLNKLSISSLPPLM